MAVHGRSQPVPAVISRNSLADAPVLTTPAPVVQQAAATPRFGQPQAAVISSAPFIAAAPPATVTPPPVVVAQAAKIAAAQPPVILRNTLADPPVLTTPAPVVIAAPVRWPPTFPLVCSAPYIAPGPSFTVGYLTSWTSPGAAALLGLLDESGVSVLAEDGGFILLEDGT